MPNDVKVKQILLLEQYKSRFAAFNDSVQLNVNQLHKSLEGIFNSALKEVQEISEMVKTAEHNQLQIQSSRVMELGKIPYPDSKKIRNLGEGTERASKVYKEAKKMQEDAATILAKLKSEIDRANQLLMQFKQETEKYKEGSDNMLLNTIIKLKDYSQL